MPDKSSLLVVPLRWVSRHWLGLTIAGFAAIFILASGPVWAADAHPDINQTVPPTTPQPTVPPPPEPTPRPKDDDKTDETVTPVAPSATSEAAQAPAVTAGTGLTATVRPVAVNVRQGPGVNFAVIGKLVNGNAVTVIGRNQGGTWWNVCCLPDSETRGWISAQLLAPGFANDQAAALPDTEATPATTTEPTAAAGQPDAAQTGAAPIDASAPAPTATLVPGSQAGTVTAVALNVRGGPGVTFAVIGKVQRGNVVSVLGRNAAGGWLSICCVPGTETSGWIAARFVTPAFLPADLPVVEPTVTP